MDPSARELLELALPELRDYALILLDRDGKVVGWLCGARDILGYAPEEMMGQTLAALFVEEDRAKGIHDFELELARKDTTSHDDRWHRRRDGTNIWVSGTVTALKRGEEVLGYAKVLRDRTDVRMGSEARANELNRLRAELERLRDSSRALWQAHGRPLMQIRRPATLLRRIFEWPKVRHPGRTAANPSVSMERLVTDLIDVSRLETGSLKLHRADVDVCAVLRAAAASHQPSATSKGIRLEVLLPRCPLVVHGDAGRLRQAIGNLVANAVKYTPTGGSVWVKGTQEDREVLVRIQDTGMGIDPAALPKIFELFTREERARAVAPGFLGVGLPMVRHIAQLHGGVIEVRSGGVGKGAEFTLRLPRSAPAHAPQQTDG